MISAPARSNGRRLSETTFSTSGPSSLPLSTSSTKPLPTCSTTLTLSSTLPLEVRYFEPLSVPAVARTPITPVLVPRAAGFTAGSIPMKRIWSRRPPVSRRTRSLHCSEDSSEYSSLNVEIAAEVAVLQATTIISAPFPSRKSVTALILSIMKSLVFSP